MYNQLLINQIMAATGIVVVVVVVVGVYMLPAI
jgi:hypothetical protein